jgi:hypothetical protein
MIGERARRWQQRVHPAAIPAGRGRCVHRYALQSLPRAPTLVLPRLVRIQVLCDARAVQLEGIAGRAARLCESARIQTPASRLNV